MKNNGIMQYFTKDYKLYFIYYLVFYVFIKVGSTPDKDVELWKFYFPFKAIVCILAIELANIHDMMGKTYLSGGIGYWDFLESINYWRLLVVMLVACFFNIVILGIVDVLVKYFTGYSLWFIFT